MPQQLTPRITLVLVSLVFSFAFGLQALGGSAASKAGANDRPARATTHPGPAPDLTLIAAPAVPALKDPRPRRAPKHHRRAAARPAPAPAVTIPSRTRSASPTPAPTIAAPRYVPTPQPRYVPPPPRPAPTSSPQPSGSFDSSGSVESSGKP